MYFRVEAAWSVCAIALDALADDGLGCVIEAEDALGDDGYDGVERQCFGALDGGGKGWVRDDVDSGVENGHGADRVIVIIAREEVLLPM